jgi:alpha-methylacyl-CoA racemase
VRVVELGGIGPGPHAAMVLADLGADVVRVERPARGPGDPDDLARDALLRGRRVVELDLKDTGDLGRLRGLVDGADVLLDVFRPGVTERLGLGPQECLASNPRLVYARVTGWGPDGPESDRAGHDLNFLALSGVLSTIGPAGAPPAVPLNLVGDYGGGSMLAVVGVLAALLERAGSGRGQVVDAAMVDGVSLLGQALWNLRGRGAWRPGRGANLIDGGAPFYDVYPCADGRYVVVGALEPAFYAELVDGLGLDPAVLPDRDDRSCWPALRAAISTRLLERTRDEWAATFAGTDACLTPVLELDEAAGAEHLRARGTLVEVAGVTQAAPAPRFSRTPAPAPVPAQRAVEPTWRSR